MTNLDGRRRAGARPRARRANGSLRRPERVLGGTLRTNGRGVAAADVGNDGRMEVAINTIGGKLVLLRPSARSGHWLDVQLSRFAPGAVVTAVLPDGRHLARRCRQAAATSRRRTRASTSASAPRRRSRRSPCATRGAARRSRTSRANRVRADRVAAARPLSSPPRLLRRRSRAARPRRAGPFGRALWNDAAVACCGWAAPRSPSRPATSSTSRRRSRRRGTRPSGQQSRETAISYAAYRLLLWRASFGANLDRTFALLTGRLRALCLSPTTRGTPGGSPAALGNRIGAAAIAAGRHDGSHEPLHYVDPGYAPQNGPLVVPAAGLDRPRRDVLAAARARAEGRPGRRLRPGRRPDVPGRPVGPRAHVRGARRRRPHRALGDPSSAAYKQAALAAIRAASRRPLRPRRRVPARLERARRGCPPAPAPRRGSRTTSGSISR